VSTAGYSQNGQDSILSSIFSTIGTAHNFFVEFGFNVPSYDYRGTDTHQGGNTGSNTRMLYEKGWRGLLMDSTFENDVINLRRHYITSDNIVALFQRYGVPADVDYVSIDIDSTDLWIFDSLTRPSSPYRPRVVSVEYNCLLPGSLTCGKACDWRGDRIYGASFDALEIVARDNGYTPVATVYQNDVFFVRSDLIHPSTAAYDYSRVRDSPVCVMHDPVEDVGRLYDGTLIDYEAYRGVLRGALDGALNGALDDSEDDSEDDVAKALETGRIVASDKIKKAGYGSEDEVYTVDGKVYESYLEYLFVVDVGVLRGMLAEEIEEIEEDKEGGAGRENEL
jgi:hypothetical protein